MLINTSAGGLPSARQTGTPAALGGTLGEILKSSLAPDYYTLTKAGRVFQLAANSANPTSFVGGAATTPLLGIYNPANSGLDLVIFRVRINIRSTGTAAQASQSFSVWGANQGGTAPSGTQTAPRNAYSLATTGSAAYCMVNVVNTGAVAASLLAPVLSLGSIGATAGINFGNIVDDMKGELIVSPGSYIALGASNSMTGGLVDAAVYWAEMPI